MDNPLPRPEDAASTSCQRAWGMTLHPLRRTFSSVRRRLQRAGSDARSPGQPSFGQAPSRVPFSIGRDATTNGRLEVRPPGES